jgi:hypothetical protein
LKLNCYAPLSKFAFNFNLGRYSEGVGVTLDATSSIDPDDETQYAWEFTWRLGLTPVHFSARRKHFDWDRGCVKGLLEGCLGGVRAY